MYFLPPRIEDEDASDDTGEVEGGECGWPIDEWSGGAGGGAGMDGGGAWMVVVQVYV